MASVKRFGSTNKTFGILINEAIVCFVIIIVFLLKPYRIVTDNILKNVRSLVLAIYFTSFKRSWFLRIKGKRWLTFKRFSGLLTNNFHYT